MSEVKAYPNLLPYPAIMPSLSASLLDKQGETEKRCLFLQGTLPAVDHPTSIAQYALVHWNAYIAKGNDEHREIFMAQADWLMNHRSTLSNGAVGWLISGSPNAQFLSRPCLSALAQGYAISVLLRAYQLTGKDAFKQTAQQAVSTFELDILDGGVSASIGDRGVFFEEFAIYPAPHNLGAGIIALLGLYDYVALTHDSVIEVLIQRGLDTLQTMINEFDTGYWTRCDLVSRRLASWSHHSLHVVLLEALSMSSGCECWAVQAARWAGYQQHPRNLLRYRITSRTQAFFDNKLKPGLRRLIFRTTNGSRQIASDRVCIPIAAFPVAGGMRGVLAGVAQVMGDQWKMIYLTHHKGREVERLEIETFGQRAATPWHFPFVWLYCLTGACKLSALLRRGPGYNLILPQDGVPSGAFAAMVGKMAGVYVVCMDHGNVTLLDNPSFRSERTRSVKAYVRPLQMLVCAQWGCYWSSQRLLAHIATRYTDRFLIAGDEVEAIYRKRLGVHPYRIIRYAYMLDANRFTPPDKECRVKMRAEQDIAEDAIVITMINRLAPEKGLDFAIEGIAQALVALPPDARIRVKVLIAGDGPLRSHLQEEIEQRGLNSICILWGEATPPDVVKLLAISDIFLYSGVRGTNYSMAVLEAMAAGCAVIASTRPMSNAKLLAEGRGIAIAAEDAEQIREALVWLVSHPELCRQMSKQARNYVATQHSAEMLKRALTRATYWSALHEFLDESEPTVANESRS